MNEEEIKALMGNVDKAIASAMTKSEGSATKEVEALKSQLADLQKSLDAAKDADKTEAIVKEVEGLAAQVKALVEKPATEKAHNTLRGALEAAFAEKADAIKAVVDADGEQKEAIKIVVKAVAPITVATTIAAGSTQNSISVDTGIISPIRKRELTYAQAVSVGSLGGNTAFWIEETDEEGTPIMVAEAATKIQLDVQYVEKTAKAKKIAVFTKVSTELMADIPQLITMIENNLMKRLDIALETQLFTGNNVGQNLNGLKTLATTFAAGALALKVDNANELDVFEAIALQVKIAFGTAECLFINPSSMAKIKLLKDSTGRPIWKDYVTTNGMMEVSGMKIVESTAVTADEFMGGDTKVMNYLIRSETSIEIGLDGNDFTKNLKTLLLEKRVVQFASANDVATIVKGDFTTAKAALETP